MEKFGLHSKRVLVNGSLVEATLLIHQSKIIEIIHGEIKENNISVRDLGNDVIMPGLIDSHVHINEPGRTDWEGFDTATQAAAAGGITTLVDMPLNSSPVTTDVMSLTQKMKAAQGQCHVNCGFWGGIIPSSLDQVESLNAGGVLGMKVFLTHSGIDEFPNVSSNDLEEIARTLKEESITLLAHCELDTIHKDVKLLDESPLSYKAYLASRPRSWEDKAIAMMIDYCKRHEIKTHIVHLSSSDSIAQIVAAKEQCLPMTVETCPHYLYFNSEEIPDGSTSHKCAPPIREKSNNDLLWQALKDGVIDFVVTDHSPAPPELKEIKSGNFKMAWGGIASIQMSLSAVWTKAKVKDFGIEEVSKWMSTNVARFLGLDHKKGRIAIGYDADLVVWNPEEEYVLEANDVFHRHKVSPYIGERLNGVVKETYVAGHLVFNNGVIEQRGKGKLILKQ